MFESLLGSTGAFDVCSNEKLSLGDMLNIIRKGMGKSRVPEAPLPLFKAISPILGSLGIITQEQLSMLNYNFYRKDTVLPKYVPNPMTYEKFISASP